MKTDVKDEWIACLLDGSYKRGRFQLRDLCDHYDPIGVLMDRASAVGVIAPPIKKDKESGATVFFGWLYDGSATRLTPAVADWSGLTYWTANHILAMNDTGATFAQVADWIMENL